MRVGNPNPTTPTTEESKLTFAATAMESSQLKTVVLASEEYCLPLQDSHTQECYVTPSNYNLNVMGVFLIECTDADGNVNDCEPSETYAIARTAFYEGDAIAMTISSTATEFTGTLIEPETDINVGGIQVVTSYIEQIFHNTETDFAQATRVQQALRGKTYRICTAPEDSYSSAEMAELCGHAEAIMGDMLIDMDGDGTFGFIIAESADTVTESSSRPADYQEFNDPDYADAKLSKHFETGGTEEYTTTDYFATAGVFAPIMSIGEVATVTQGLGYEYAVTFNIADSIKFTDGFTRAKDKSLICVTGLTDYICMEDDDPASVGFYNMYYDNAFLPSIPVSELAVTEVEAEDSEE